MRILLLFSSRAGEAVARGLADPPIETYVAPYFTLRDAGAETVLATVQGGFPPVAASAPADKASALAGRFRRDPSARDDLADTLRLDQLWADDFDALYVGGGHGALLDLIDSTIAAGLVSHFVVARRPVALVGHGVAAGVRATVPDAVPLVRDRRVTAPSNDEETACGASTALPLLLQDELIRLGARYECAEAGASHVVRDDLLITAQNQHASIPAAGMLLDLLSSGSGRG